jgi:hypothetical protein
MIGQRNVNYSQIEIFSPKSEPNGKLSRGITAINLDPPRLPSLTSS